MVTAPCKDCPDRQLGCHGTCEKYQEYRRKRDEEAVAERQRVDSYCDMYAYKKDKVRRLKH